MRRLALLLVLVLGPLSYQACRIYEPSNRPLDNCHARCVQMAKRECSDDECWRGCELILDRIIERESKSVIACVGNGARRCTNII